jgi:hypothetical protein
VCPACFYPVDLSLVPSFSWFGCSVAVVVVLLELLFFLLILLGSCSVGWLSGAGMWRGLSFVVSRFSLSSG